MKDQRIAIIGGTGNFGQHMGERLEEDNEIMISGKTVERAKAEAGSHGWDYGKGEKIVRYADIVIVSVPIDVTVEVIHEIGPNVTEGTLLCDVTSVKQRPVEAMKQYSDQVLGMHPMYAPSNSIKGQKVVLCPEKGDKWELMEEFWKQHGADIHFTDPESHDQATSIIQGLMHFSELVIADVIRKSEASTEDLEAMETPIYQILTDLTARMLNQKPELYGSIQKENPEVEEVRRMCAESVEEMKEIVDDEGRFAERFEELGREFDLESAQKRSDRVIEFLSSEIRTD